MYCSYYRQFKTKTITLVIDNKTFTWFQRSKAQLLSLPSKEGCVPPVQLQPSLPSLEDRWKRRGRVLGCWQTWQTVALLQRARHAVLATKAQGDSARPHHKSAGYHQVLVPGLQGLACIWREKQGFDLYHTVVLSSLSSSGCFVLLLVDVFCRAAMLMAERTVWGVSRGGFKGGGGEMRGSDRLKNRLQLY